MDRLTTVLIFLIPQLLDIIVKNYDINEKEATALLYSSELFETLEEERTKLWHLSAHALFDLFHEEQQTGQITYPEEA